MEDKLILTHLLQQMSEKGLASVGHIVIKGKVKEVFDLLDVIANGPSVVTGKRYIDRRN